MTQKKMELFLFAIISLSALRISDFEYQRVSYLLNQSDLYVGELILAPIKKNQNLYLGSKAFEKNKQQQFAVVGLKTPPNLSITSYIQRPSTISEKLFGRTYIAKINTLKVNKPVLKRKNYLRLPSNTWEKVNKKNQLRADSKKMKEILNQDYSNNDLSCFQAPLLSKRISKFASPRTLPDGRAYYHSGVDLRSYTPEPIKSIGKGLVVYAGHMTAPGNLVVIHHGKGIFSRYMHLSKINVKSGEKIQKGQSIGFSGGTGRVEAPHLHWEIIWKGNYANPEHFLPLWNRDCSPS